PLVMEPVALTAAECDRKENTLTFMIIEKGASSKIPATLKIGDPIALMGPTGIKAKIASTQETVLIIGNQMGLALLRSYGRALREAGNRVIFLGYFNHAEEAYCQTEIEDATDVVIWVTQFGKPISTNRTE